PAPRPVVVTPMPSVCSAPSTSPPGRILKAPRSHWGVARRYTRKLLSPWLEAIRNPLPGATWAIVRPSTSALRWPAPWVPSTSVPGPRASGSASYLQIPWRSSERNRDPSSSSATHPSVWEPSRNLRPRRPSTPAARSDSSHCSTSTGLAGDQVVEPAGAGAVVHARAVGYEGGG